MNETKSEKIESVKFKKYKPKFKKLTAYQAKEKTTMRLINEERHTLQENEYFVMLDWVNNVIIPEEIFRKLFIIEQDE